MGRVDDEEFSDFVLGASPRLLRTAWLLCGDPVHAEELVQASLEKVYLKWARVREGEPLAYTRRIVVNLHVDHVRRTRREYLTDVIPEQPAAAVAAPEEGDYLMHLLRQLPLRERQAVVLRHYVGESEAQAATTLGVSVGTVKSSASRGLARMRALHAQEGSHVR